MTCTEPLCSDSVTARGLCRRHYGYAYRHGLPMRAALKRSGRRYKVVVPMDVDFWARVLLGDGCWVWTGSRDQKGYGRVRRHPRVRPAHRYAYEAMVGPVPKGLLLDHLCRNPSCVRPDHLEPVTNRENCRRGLRGVLYQRKLGDVARGGTPKPENRCRSVDPEAGRCRRTSGHGGEHGAWISYGRRRGERWQWSLAGEEQPVSKPGGVS